MDSVTSFPSAPVVILFGSPGSGKGTQAKLLRSCLKGPHISTGDMLRSHINQGDEIGQAAGQLIRAGKLVSDDLVNQLIERRLAEPDAQHGMILDGYPRTLNQAGVLLELLKTSGLKVAVVHLMVDSERIVSRLSGRRQCPSCGTLYSVTTNPSKIAGVCDLDGTPLVTRDDDRESVIRERLFEYDRQTVPIINFFREAGVPMFELEGGSAAPEEIMQTICRSLASIRLLNGVVTNDGVGSVSNAKNPAALSAKSSTS
ncbi:MAG: nucleoside monophosphate kinase [Acidobacteriota bacterium]|nr:nucleoside monophosphate kinase [Acidobacteriota bacterium]